MINNIFKKQKITLIIFGLLLSIFLIETGLRIGGFVHLAIKESENRLSLKQNEKYRILCLGESTTDRQWPSMLQRNLNKQNIETKCSVIDKGIVNTNTGVILSRLKTYINKYRPNMIITMIGINDDPSAIELSVNPLNQKESAISFFKSLRIYKLVKHIKSNILARKNKIKRYFYKKRIENKVADKRELGMLSEYQMQEEMPENAEKENIQSIGEYIEWRKWRQGEENRSEESFKKAILKAPENKNPQMALALYYSRKRKYSKAEKSYKKVIAMNPEYVNAYLALGWCYTRQRKYDKAEENFRKVLSINPENEWSIHALIDNQQQKINTQIKEIDADFEYFRLDSSVTHSNYKKIRDITVMKNIQLVCVQYPMRKVETLREILGTHNDILFVDNEMTFKDSVEAEGYDKYFIDAFAGDFGHCTEKGNRLLAENIAKVIVNECLSKKNR